MRYEDTSGAFQASGPVANDDSDTLAAGSRGPATGNLITGEGTQYGSAGADSAAGAHITAIAGKGGEDSSFAGGKLSVAGEFGQLSVDGEGNYSYMANKGAPENVRDRFTYTLADNQGNSDTAALIVEIGKTPVVIKAGAQQIVPGPDGVVTLPPGVELSDIMVVGRNLVVNMPDGTQLIIVDGAVFVPQLSLGGVEVPATNVAALLIGQEPQPAAGETPPSSGGNFALPPPPLDPGVPLGDLLPPTEYNYRPPEPQETFLPEDNEPEIFVQPDGQPATVAAVDQVEEAGLPTRNGGEPAGSAESADGNGADNDVNSETTTGNIIYTSDDTPNVITLNGVEITSVGQVIHGDFGNLTITSIAPGVIGYSYTLLDNTSGNDTHDDFAVQLTDADGDIASATLRIDIIDDVPTARPDTDSVGVGGFLATGNVITDASLGDIGDSDTNAADTVGADNASLTSVSGAGGSDSSFSEGVLTVNGQYGVLTIDAQGNYTYVRNPSSPGGVQDVFNYTLTDGDGDTSTTTLTIDIPDTPISIQFGNGVGLDDDVIPGAGGNPGGPDDDAPDVVGENVVLGDFNAQGGDGALTYSLQTGGAPTGFTYVAGPGGSLLIQQGGVTVITITINSTTGEYSVTQNAPIDHPSLDGQSGDNTENNVVFPVTVRVTDADGDFAEATGQIIVDDDTPIALEELVTGTVDEDGVPGGIAGGPGDVGGEDNVSTGSVVSLFSIGADAPAVYNLLSDTSGLPGLTSHGAAVTYAVNGNTLTASAGGNTVFTFTLNPNGSWTFTLVDQIDHPTLDGLPGDNTENDLSIALGSIIQVTDGDGDSVTANANGLVITVDDDTPTAQDISVNQASEDANVQINIVGSIAGGADGVDLADVTFSAHNGSGNLSYDNGVFTYDPAPGEEGDVTFSYTIVDFDGDEVTKEITIHLQPDSEPQVGTPENLEVDEDGFGFANDDANPLQSNPSETDHGENLTDTGQVVVDFGNDVPSAPLANSIVLLDSGALDGQLVDLDGNPVTFALVGGQLVGTANGTQVMIISITGAVAGPGAGEVTYSYQAQLLQPVQHADVGNTENSDLLSGVQFQVTDSDGDTAGGSFSVTVWDDVPSASDIEVNQPSEDANVVIDITGSIVEGADGVDLADVTFGAHDGSGSLSYNDNGVFTYDPAPGEQGDVSFTYTIVDGDGDEITKTITIHLLNDSAPSAGNSAALLDDDGLAGGNPASTTGDIDANVGEVAPTNSNEAIFHGLLNFNFGTDGAGSINFAAMDGQNGTVGTETVVYNWDAGALELTATTVGGTRPGTLLFTLELDDATSGEYTLTLNDNVLHAAGGNETSAPNVVLNFTVLDSDNTSANGTLTITFNDDAPTLNVTAGPEAGVTLTTDDVQTIGGASDSAVTTANFGGVFGLTQAIGADGGTAATLNFALNVSAPGVDSGLNQGGANIYLYLIGGKVVGSTAASAGLVDASNTVFDVGVSGTGVVTLTQYSQIDHPIGQDPVSMTDTLITLTASASITDADGDTANDSEVINIGANLRFTDDVPDVAAALTGTQIRIDETDGVVAAGGEVDPVGGNLGTVTMTLASLVNITTPHVSADSPTTNVYSLVLSANGVDSGLDLSSTNASIFLYNIGGQIVGSTALTSAGVNAGNTAFTVSIDSTTGAVTLTQFLGIEHPTPGASHDEDSSGLAAGVLNLQVTATDFDGDTDSAQVDLGSVIRFEDDGPVIIEATDAQGDNTGDTPTAVGIFDFDVGSDSPNVGDDDISIDPDSVVISINGVALDPVANSIVFTEGSEDANTASFNFSFEYDTGTGGLTPATGTLVFDKNAGTYTVTLTSGPIEGFSTLQTAQGSAFVGYELNDDPSDPDVLDNTQPQVAVTTILEESGVGENDGFYVQFTGFSAGNANHETINYDLVDPATGNGVDSSWTEGELFSEGTGATALTQSWVSVSNASNGVAGDTVNGPDALNFSLYSSNPGGTFGGTPTASASDMFLVFDGTDSGDDFIVVLKLFDPDSGEYTTKSIVVEGSDIYFFDAANEAGTVAALAGTPYEEVVADIVALGGSNNNDGLVIIESNDYNSGSENWVIVGAQIVNTNKGVTGTGINLDGGVGDDGDSTGTQSFAVVDDTAPMKITNIGFLAGTSNDQSLTIDFDVTVTDADGDTQTTSLSAQIGDPVAPASLPLSTMLASSEPADSGSFSNLSYTNDNLKLDGHGNDKNFSFNNTGIVAGIVAAAGLQSTAVAGSPTFEHSVDVGLQDTVAAIGLPAYRLESIDDGSLNVQSFGLESSEPAFDVSALQGSSHSFGDFVDGGALDFQSYTDSAPAYLPNFQADQAPTFDASMLVATVAPAVGMPSAEALIAAGVAGIQQGGSVEQILAEALGNQAPTVDGLLAAVNGGGDQVTSPTIEAALNALPGGGGAGDLSAVLNGASPDVGVVSGWDMHSAGSFGAGFEMMFKMDVASFHQDAVQPAING